MKICYLGNSSSAHIIKWAGSLAARGHEVHVISTRPVAIEGVEVHKVGIGRLKLLSDLLSIIECKRLLESIKPDLVHAHYATDYGLLGALMNYHPLVISPWGSDILIQAKNSAFWKRAVKFTFGKADAITCTSNYLFDAASKYFPASKLTRVIPFGIDQSVFKPPAAKKDSSGKNIGTLKALTSICGVEYLIRAIPHIAKIRQDFRVFIAGAGDQRPYRNLARELGVAEYIEFMGAIPQQEVPEYLRSLDIFIMPSLSESFGVAALEAEAVGVPVIATGIGGIPEVVQDGETGFLIEQKNPEALADVILKLLEDEKLRKRMGQKGCQFVKERYDWSNNLDQIESLYQELLGKAGR